MCLHMWCGGKRGKEKEWCGGGGGFKANCLVRKKGVRMAAQMNDKQQP